MDKDHSDPQELDLTKPPPCIVQAKVEKAPGYGVLGSIYSLLNVKDWSSIKQDVMQSSFTIRSQLIVSRKLLWWNLKKSYTRRYICHLDHHRQFPTKIFGCVIWILKSLEAAKITNESNQNLKLNYQVRWDPYVGKSPQRKSRNVLCLIARMSQTQQVRGDPYWWIKKRSTKLISEYQDCHL